MEALLLTAEQAADVLNVSRTTIFKLMAGGELDSLKIGRSRRIPAQSLERFVESLRAEASGDGE